MLLFSILILGCAVVLYSVLFFDVPIPAWVRNILGGLRLVFLIFLLYLLINPNVTETVSTRLTPTLYVALDDSHSMSYPVYPNLASENEPSRYDVMINTLQNGDILNLWKDKGFQLRFANLSNMTQQGASWNSSLPTVSKANAPQTNLSAAIKSFDTKSQSNDAAYLMLFTDGQWTEGGSPIAAVEAMMQKRRGEGRALDYRVYSFGIGTTEEIFDLLIESFYLPSDIRAGDAINAEIEISYRGEQPTEPVLLRLQGIRDDETVVFDESNVVAFEEGTSSTLSFSLPEMEKGEYKFTADIGVQDEELFSENNVSVRGVRVRESKDRVLILTSAPTWDIKFLKRAMEDHPSIETQAYFIHDEGLTFLGDPDKAEEENTPPDGLPVFETIETLENSFPQWSVIVLSNFYFRPDLQELAQRLNVYLEEGGGVVVLPGQYNSTQTAANIEAILPGLLTRAYVPVQQSVIIAPNDAETSPLLSQISDEQKQNLIPLTNWYRPVKADETMTPGQVLLRGTVANRNAVPLVEQYRLGLGRVIIAYTDSFWKWGMQLKDDILPVFWVSTVYQAQPQLLSTAGEIYTGRFTYSPYQPVEIEYTIRETIRDATSSNLSLVVKHDEEEERIWLESQPGKPNTYQGRYTPTESGEYTLSTISGDAQTSFSVEASLEELRDLRQNVSSLREIANAGGGEYANQPAWKSMAENVPLSTQIKEETTQRFLGEKWWVITLLITLLGLEWFTRWRRGLP